MMSFVVRGLGLGITAAALGSALWDTWVDCVKSDGNPGTPSPLRIVDADTVTFVDGEFYPRQAIDGLWLTHISLSAMGDKTRLEGRAIRAELIRLIWPAPTPTVWPLAA